MKYSIAPGGLSPWVKCSNARRHCRARRDCRARRHCLPNTTGLEKELGVEKGRFIYITRQLSVQTLFLGKTTLRLETRDWTDLPFEKELGGEKGMMIDIMDVRRSDCNCTLGEIACQAA
jgi:hypothetical protein